HPGLARDALDLSLPAVELREAAAVAQCFGDRLRIAQVGEQAVELAEREERAAQVEADVDGLLGRLATGGHVSKRDQRLLEVAPCLPVGRARRRLLAGLPQVGHCRGPPFAAEGVVGESLDLLALPIGIERLDRLHDGGVDGAATVVEEAAVGDLLRERVLKTTAYSISFARFKSPAVWRARTRRHGNVLQSAT